MDIVLPTRFNNPNLPVVQRPGFIDNFDRGPADALGTTDDGKTWDYFGFIPWKLTGNGSATGLGASLHAAVDGLTPNGTLATVVGKAATESADKRAGLVFRMLDRDNFLYVCPNTTNTLALYGRIGGSLTVNQSISGETLATGDTLAVAMDGPSITILRNGTAVHTATINDLTSATMHGFYGNVSSDAEWDSIEFTPA